LFSIKRVDPSSEEVGESWSREIVNPLDRSRFGVDASKSAVDQRWPWQVNVWAMSGIRDNSLEKELRRAIMKALRAVPGVLGTKEGDREFWIVRGAPSGDALVTAVAAVVDSYAAELRAYLR
jgi:hypothetical protein